MKYEKEHKEDKIEDDTEEKKEISSQKETLVDKIKENPWKASTVVLGVIGLMLLFSTFSGLTGSIVTGSIVNEEDAGEALLDFANQQGANAELVGVEDIGDFYEVTLMIQGTDVPLMVTKDGKYFLSGSLVPLVNQESPQQESETQNIPKSNKPVVELFIMTHCPYGTQAEKGIIPTIETLGNTIDAKIRFVHYFMHEPEETETPRQICIREEQSEKYYDYLKCFLEDGDANRCLTKAGVDENKISDCISNGKADEYYEEDSELSEGYGVSGSPTLVINGIIVSSGRSPAGYLTTICSVFNDAPEECNIELSSASPSPMWGYEEGTDTQAQC